MRRFYAVYDDRLSQLVEGRVTKFDEDRGVMTVALVAPGFSERQMVEVPYVNRGVATRPFGFACSIGSNGSIRLEGDLKKLPQVGQKILMQLLYQGEDGWRCLGWTPKELAEAVITVYHLAHAKIEGVKLS